MSFEELRIIDFFSDIDAIKRCLNEGTELLKSFENGSGDNVREEALNLVDEITNKRLLIGEKQFLLKEYKKRIETIKQLRAEREAQIASSSDDEN